MRGTSPIAGAGCSNGSPGSAGTGCRNTFASRPAGIDTDSAYWVRIDELTPGVLASVDAVRTGSDVKLTTQNVGALTITGPARTVSVDGVAVRLRAGARAVIRESGSALVAGDGLAGGQAAGHGGADCGRVARRHIWVYGTAGSANEEELAHRRAVAQAGATWSSARARVNAEAVGQGRSRRDREEIASANLLLFGTRESNALVARFASKLPMELNPGAADYGMVLIAPEGGRYLVVSGGTAWWTGAEEADRGGYRFAPAQYRLLSTFPDYVIFKGGIDRVLAEGSFDRDWKLPADARRNCAPSAWWR